MSDMTVVELSGQAWIRDDDGNLRQLEPGDVIDANRTVVTEENTLLVLMTEGGEPILLPGNSATTPADLVAGNGAEPRPEASADEGEDSRNSVPEAMVEGQDDPLNSMAEPADGAEDRLDNPGSNSHSDSLWINEGHPFVRVARIQERLDPLEYQYGIELRRGPEPRRGGARAADEPRDMFDIAASRPQQDEPGVTVELLGAGDDGIYSQTDIGADGSVTARITLEDGTRVGDTLRVVDEEGNRLLDRPVTQADLDNGIQIEVPVAPGDTEVGVTATVTNPAGNTGRDDDARPIDNVPPAVSVELTGAGDDGVYNQAEIGPDGSVTARVTLEDGTRVGDTLVVVDREGNRLLDRPVTQADLDNGVDVEVPVAPGDTEVGVIARVIDPAGNTGRDDAARPVDNVSPGVAVELIGAGDDGGYTQAEIGPDGSVTARVTLQDGTRVGDTLRVVDRNGNTLLDRPVTRADLDNGIQIEVPVTPGDTEVGVTATVRDSAGNVRSDDDAKPVVLGVRLEADGPVIEGEPITLTASMDNIAERDVTLTLNDGTQILIPAGETSASVTVPSRDDDALIQGDVTTTYEIVDTVGSGYARVDTGSPAEVVTRDDSDVSTVTLTATDSVLESGAITYTARLDGGPAVNDIQVTLESGGTITIPAGQTSGTLDIPLDDDVYVDPQTITDRITGAREVDANGSPIAAGTPGSLEALQVDATPVATQVNDSIDTVSVVLTATDSVVEGGEITYTANLVDAEGNAVSANNAIRVQLNNGETITLAVGESSGEIRVAAPADDVYVDAGEVTARITGAEEIDGGGNVITANTPGSLEDLQVDDTSVATQVSDSLDPVTVELSATD
ncbi:retention module-containing protein, partial [Pistricoccus aurantiacus]|uniref:retention module-containing protein n=1 Tax=Pistricoccus aurantiacus TaxID=1883414 RepID=UPI0036388AFA